MSETNDYTILHYSGICNMEECKLVVEICKVLLHSTEVTVNGIGIITPYKHQERKLKEVLHEKIHGLVWNTSCTTWYLFVMVFLNVYSSGTIDVGTVDSFQVSLQFSRLHVANLLSFL